MMRRGGFGHYAGGHAGYGHGGRGAQSARGATSNRPTPGATIDPVNGKPVRTDKALTTLYRGSIYYFASRENRDRFEAAPQDYAPRFAGGRVDSDGTVDHQTRRRGC
ncbi:MAG: YHS domain-containing protein [Burkholderiales bacterium]|nr:YHS domain-containing protein [Burkholderiales bacterium]